MIDNLDKLMLAGLGMLSMTREKAEKLFDEYVRRGQAQRDGRAGFVQEMVETADKARSEMQRMIAEQIRHALETLHLASREDIQRLEQKIEQLLCRER